MSTTSEEEDFPTTFANAVRGGLDKVLGQSGAAAVLSHMKMTPSAFPDPAEFHEKLLVLFGQQATLSLERAILKDIVKRLKWALELLSVDGPFDFSATMHKIQKRVKA
jgi:hypothetical protein